MATTIVLLATGVVTAGAFIGSAIANWFFSDSSEKIVNTNELKSEINVMSSDIKTVSLLEIALLTVILTFALIFGVFVSYFIYKKCSKKPNIEPNVEFHNDAEEGEEN